MNFPNTIDGALYDLAGYEFVLTDIDPKLLRQANVSGASWDDVVKKHGSDTRDSWDKPEPSKLSYSELEKLMRRGIIHPIVVEKQRNGYMLIDGTHRTTIANHLGLTSIPAYVWENPYR